ncbi:hypothetical protein OIU85_022002, partial [Salix viminalis]
RREEGDEDDLGGGDDDLGDECGDLEAEIHGEESEERGDGDEGERRERRLVCEVFENAENEEDAEIRNNPTEKDAHPTTSIQSTRRSDQLTHGLDPTVILTPDGEVDS